MSPEAPLATGYIAPIHGRGAMGFFLLGLVSLVVLLAGAFSPSAGVALLGAGGLALAAAGFAAYWKLTESRPHLLLFADRLEFLRGPQRGVIVFDDVVTIGAMEWGRSFFPYSRAQRVLVLRSAATEWQIGSEIRDHARFQDEVATALNRHRAAPARATGGAV
jgi:hypothetical protein